jgi:hypothetical protein
VPQIDCVQGPHRLAPIEMATLQSAQLRRHP